MLPSGSDDPCGTCSGNPVAVPGMFHTSQCSWSSVVPASDTSGSCMSSTKLCVLGGGFVQLSWGETCSAAWVYFTGISSPSGQPLVVNVIEGGAGAAPRAGTCGACAAEFAAMAISDMSAIVIIFVISFAVFICSSGTHRNSRRPWVQPADPPLGSDST